MRKAVIGIGLAVVALLLLGLAVVVALESAWTRNWVAGRASEQLGRQVTIGDHSIDWGWPLALQATDIRLSNVAWADDDMATLDGLRVEVNPGALFRGEVDLESVRLERPVIRLARRADGTTNWDDLLERLAGDETAEEQEGTPVWPRAFTIERGFLVYRDEALDAALEVDLETPGESLDELRLAMRGEGRMSEDALAFEALASYHGLEQRGALESLEGQIGASHVQGALMADIGGEVPRFEVFLAADELDLNRRGLLDEPPQGSPTAADGEVEAAGEESWNPELWDRRVAEALAVLEGYEASWELSIDRLAYADQTLQDLVFEGRLEEGRLHVGQLHAVQQLGDEEPGALTVQGRVEARQQLVAEVNASFERIDLTAALAPLGLGDLGMLDGRLNTQMAQGGLVIDDTELDYQGPAFGVALSLQASARDIQGRDHPGVHLVGEGGYQDEPFAFDLVVGPLLDLFDNESAYPVFGELSSGEVRLRLDAGIERPLELAAVAGAFQLEGPSPAALSGLAGIELPELPPFRIATRLDYRDDLVQLEEMEGGVGGSDISGEVRVQLGERPMIWATLTSEVFDFDDVLGWLEEEAEEQPGLFSDDPWDVQALRDVDAEVDYQAADVRAGYVPLTDVSLALALDQGVLTLEPLQVGLGGGEVVSWLTLNAQQEALQGDLRITIDQVNLRPLLREAGLPEVAEDSIGILGGRSDLHIQGRSLAEVMAGLDGDLELAMSQGWLDIIAAELLPLNVANALVEALAGSGQVELQCSYVHLVAEDGLVRLDEFFMATEGAHLVGAGAINLESEEMEVAFEGHNKDFTIFTGNSPVELAGPLDDLGVNVVTPELLARGLATLLGALVAPPAAILPWIDLGGGEEVGMGCERALAEFPDNELIDEE